MCGLRTVSKASSQSWFLCSGRWSFEESSQAGALHCSNRLGFAWLHWAISSLSGFHATVFYLHAALPCGTCSRARERLRRRGVPDPKPLRTTKFPDGIPTLTGVDKEQVQLANSVYANICKIIINSLPEHCVIPVENPTRSHMWATSWFRKLIKRKELFPISFQACMHGSIRGKWATFYTNHSGFSSLSLVCDNNHTHVPWGVNKNGDGRRFNIAEESEYTLELCSKIANIMPDAAHPANVIPNSRACWVSISRAGAGSRGLAAFKIRNGTLEPWNPGTLEPWNPGTLEPWTLEPWTLEPWNLGTLDPGTLDPETLECRNPATLEPRNGISGTLEPWNLGNPDRKTGTLEPWNPGTLNLGTWNPGKFWNPGTLKPWNPGTREPWNPGTPEPWNPETLEPWNPKTVEPWNLGTLAPWNPATLEPWNPGTLEPCNPGNLEC